MPTGLIANQRTGAPTKAIADMCVCSMVGRRGALTIMLYSQEEFIYEVKLPTLAHREFETIDGAIETATGHSG